MSDKNYLNKSSQYVQSLVDFVLDTKPYHSKLTEIVEEYQFFENMSVKVEEQTLLKTKISPTWTYNYFSGANPLFRTMPAQRVVSPTFRRESHLVGTDENTDLKQVPYAYSKKAFDGVGVNAVYVRRAGGHVEPLTESVDYFQSHGSFQFQIKQTLNAMGELDPLWSETRDDGVVAAAIAQTQANALDSANPGSAISVLRGLLNNIQEQTTLARGDKNVQAELDALFKIINGPKPTLPRSYEVLLTALDANKKILVNTANLKRDFTRLSSPLFFNMFTDMGVRQSGLPGQKIVIAANAPLETWDIIKVNPIAHDRPIFSSTAYGFVVDRDGKVGQITLLDQTLPDTDIILTARTGGTTFDLTSSNDPSHVGVAQVGVPFNDGRVAFTIKGGEISSFQQGDTFYIPVKNIPALADELDLGYGYDLDPYSDDATVTPETFGYDGRFTDFDFSQLNITVSQAAIDGRRWRIRAKVPPNATPFAERTLSSVNGAAPGAGVSLSLFYTTVFAVEWSDDDFHTINYVQDLVEGGTFNGHGVKFTLASAGKPYVAASSLDSGPRVEGGDVFSFVIRNPWPVITELPVGLNATRLPRLIMHSDGFYAAPAAKWTLTFTTPTQYILTTEQADGFATSVEGTPLTVNIPTVGAEDREGLSFRGFGVHYTIVQGTGLRAGDKFTFQTYERKPSFMVHGSVSGFRGTAAYGELFNNGLIQFTIEKPTALTYVGDEPVEIPGFTYELREDCPSLTYTFTPSQSGYLVTRSDIGVTGLVEGGTFQDRYLRANIGSATGPFKLDVNASELAFWNAQDVVFLNSQTAARLPKVGDYVVIEKTEDGTFGIALTPNQRSVAGLAPITIDQRFIDINTNQPIQLSSTSPETTILQGWLPLLVEKHDSATSIAEFSDPTTMHKVRSAATNEVIGQLRQLDPTNLNEPIAFEWDTDFFLKYLPLNAEANIVTNGTGWNEQVKVNISESVKFLIGGGALTEDWMFGDRANVNFLEDTLFKVKTNLVGNMKVNIQDGPFAKFMPGYANMPYEGELNGQGSYDLGVPLTSHFHEAQALLDIERTTEEEERLHDLLGLLGNFLNEDLASTTLDQFLANIAIADELVSQDLSTDDFGYPLRGLGIDINTTEDTKAKAGIKEALTFIAVDKANLHDTNGYDLGLLDSQDDIIAISYSGSLPPIASPIPAGATFESYDTPLSVAAPARVFEVSFNATPEQLATMSPRFLIWLPDQPTAVQVPVVERISPSLFRFSIPRASRAKIAVG